MNDKQVYADLTALESWNKELNTLNNDAITILNNISKEATNLDEEWQGNIPSGFTNATNNLITDMKSYHTKMKNVDNILTTIKNNLNNR